ncbi:branched-chain amino acid ABC transporter permease [Corynebacterium sp. sy017]|uniref:branched-chain amino acid transporter permease n=1 Tax=unclassified Corynebacterium TaxID=2624378 RepID=UPI001186477B|nr:MULTISPECIES: AzlD domain-containing protein [unclassified Corynebacterium]MBP3088250.1 branched-chain amino acid ABC transporter permease [Corynebacterium sp. sy017]QDZ43432.1 branched-chain amino acid ABC transporter permease [Corynebacterium sp. sy039]TSD91578.1 branched-chain amino acid ABC transporter permease [Corynebacterium sp. SY003]
MINEFTATALAGLPPEVTLEKVVAVLLPVGIVTVLLRQLPFSAVRFLKGSSFMALLSRTMPVGVMTVLVIYTLYSSRTNPGGIGASALALFATLLLHWWRRNAGLSIVGGVVCYMLLVNIVFA